ncbi:hypothetical protein K3G63_11120 [Hymenobacter sp. HSC-4F20]|uniref:hypothetical protein n=1 Tax=Hymenobacter sp. HSC-4F20 TaxID=2864135 RepID=UPI001C737C14|nr:hypothetical protein [Hymenobacter sp. HSC-4F20]MBX0290994.1 hypothetical protein [Hymenobacter sp. HSC-4F20]
MKGFKAYLIDTTSGSLPASRRRDYSNITLLSGKGLSDGTGRETEREGTYLLLGHPPPQASVNWLPLRQTGYGCLFTEAFVNECSLTGGRQPWSLLTSMGRSIFWLPNEQAAYLTGLFQQMLTEQQSTYPFKHELLRSYLHLVLHEVMRLPPPPSMFRCYIHLPGSAGGMRSSWRSRQRCWF